MRTIAFIVLLFCCSQAVAEETCGNDRRNVVFTCWKPGELLLGAGSYVCGVGLEVAKGTKQILLAPFNSEFCWPDPVKMRWQPGYWTPGRFERLDLYYYNEHDFIHPLYIEPLPITGTVY